MKKSNILLSLGAMLSFSVAIFQTVVSFSPSWSLYLGAPAEMVAKPLMLLILGEACALFFAVFGFYALSGAGHIRSLPMLRWGLLVIGLIYTIRGLLIVPLILSYAGLFRLPDATEPTVLQSSSISLLIGIVYLLGTGKVWNQLKRVRNA